MVIIGGLGGTDSVGGTNGGGGSGCSGSGSQVGGDGGWIGLPGSDSNPPGGSADSNPASLWYTLRCLTFDLSLSHSFTYRATFRAAGDDMVQMTRVDSLTYTPVVKVASTACGGMCLYLFYLLITTTTT
jgi:hypothetical protein